MARRTRFEVILDTSFFTADGVQHRTFLAMAMNGWARWLREHLGLSFRQLVFEHHAGVVVAGGDLEYLEPFHFLDADQIEADVGVKVYRGGAFLRLELEARGAGRPIARVIGTLRPVLIGGGPGLDALPGNLPAPVLERFLPDEMESGSVRLQVAEQIEEIEDNGRLIASSDQPLFIHRHLVEAADQWSFVEFSTFGEMGRDKLSIQHGKEHSILGEALSRPLKSSKMQMVRPLFVFDEATLSSKAYLFGPADELVFVHRVTSGMGVQRPSLMGIERLRDPAPPQTFVR